MPAFACPHHPLAFHNSARPAPDAPVRAAGGHAMRITCRSCGASRIEYRDAPLICDGPTRLEVGPWGPSTQAYELELHEVRLVVAQAVEAWREAMRAVADAALVIDGASVVVSARGALRRVDDGEHIESAELAAEREVIAAAWEHWRSARDRLDELERAKAREPVPYWVRSRQADS